MTVIELIEHLKTFPQDMTVVAGCADESDAVISADHVTLENMRYYDPAFHVWTMGVVISIRGNPSD